MQDSFYFAECSGRIEGFAYQQHFSLPGPMGHVSYYNNLVSIVVVVIVIVVVVNCHC